MMFSSPIWLKFRKIQFMPGSVVLIQGGSSGVGKELAKIYAARGCPVCVTGRNEKELQSVVKYCQDEYGNGNVQYVLGDTTIESDCERIVDFTIKKFSRIDICVLSAGTSAYGRFDGNSNIDVMKKVMDVNFFGYVNMTKYVLPHLLKTRG